MVFSMEFNCPICKKTERLFFPEGVVPCFKGLKDPAHSCEYDFMTYRCTGCNVKYVWNDDWFIITTGLPPEDGGSETPNVKEGGSIE